MNYSYESYLSQPHVMTVEKMQEIHNQLLSEIDSDEDAQDFYKDLLNVSVRYADIRSNWNFLSVDDKLEKDSSRTSCHDSVITHINMLARYLKSKGKSAEWRDKLGYIEDDIYNRKIIGDFACYLSFMCAVNAR